MANTMIIRTPGPAYKSFSTAAGIVYQANDQGLIEDVPPGDGAEMLRAGYTQVQSNPYPRVIAGTTGELTADDNNVGVQCINSDETAITVPAGLGPFGCPIYQMGTSAVHIVAGEGVTIHQNSFYDTIINGQYKFAVLLAMAPDVYVLGGQLAAD